MSRTINVDDRFFAWLQENGTALVDTPNSVLRRIAGLDRSPSDHRDLLRRVDELALPVRCANCLMKENIVYVRDLVQKTEGQLLRINKFGQRSLNVAKEVLAQMGLHFGMEITNWPPDNIEILAEQLGDQKPTS